MKNAHELYKHFKERNFRLTAIDEITERGNVIDLMFDYYLRVESEKKELLEFVKKVYHEQWINNKEFMDIIKKFS